MSKFSRRQKIRGKAIEIERLIKMKEIESPPVATRVLDYISKMSEPEKEMLQKLDFDHRLEWFNKITN